MGIRVTVISILLLLWGVASAQPPLPAANGPAEENTSPPPTVVTLITPRRHSAYEIAWLFEARNWVYKGSGRSLHENIPKGICGIMPLNEKQLLITATNTKAVDQLTMQIEDADALGQAEFTFVFVKTTRTVADRLLKTHAPDYTRELQQLLHRGKASVTSTRHLRLREGGQEIVPVNGLGPIRGIWVELYNMIPPEGVDLFLSVLRNTRVTGTMRTDFTPDAPPQPMPKVPFGKTILLTAPILDKDSAVLIFTVAKDLF